MPEAHENLPILDEKSTPKAQGERLRRLRNITNMSRLELIHKYNIPTLNTYKNWELGGVKRGLPKSALRKINEICRGEGIQFTIEWLLHGIGQGPQIAKQFDETSTADTPELKEEKKMLMDELMLFRQHVRDAIDIVMPDDSMAPRFVKGEYAAGEKLFKKDLASAVGLDCIVQTEDGKLLLRHVRERNEKGLFTLMTHNTSAEIKEPVLYEVKIVNAAPVIWQRRKTN